MELLSIKNPNSILLKRRIISSSSSSSCSSLINRRPTLSLTPRSLDDVFPPCLSLTHSHRRRLIAFAASRDESKQSKTNNNEEDKLKEESEEAWKQMLADFKEQAVKMQSVSQEAYEIYSKKATVILKQASEQLKIDAQNARVNLADVAKEITEESKEYIVAASENSPQSLKEVVETLSSAADDLDDISEVRDFLLGIPYGLILSVGGFLSFMVTGSLTGIRFGVILGGILLALSVSSLRSYKRGEPYGLALKGQATIAAILFLREARVMSQRLTFLTVISTVISGAMVAFYIYRIQLNRKERKRSNLEPGAEN
ncbi:hypothetical protein ACFE04_003386 [Oxalis oulophora]